jgi:glycosyltransferase involved in cell wall biosynthesis
MKIAMVAPYPAQMVLKPEQINPAYRNRSAHAAPWVRSLTTALAKRNDVEFHVFTHSRAVSRVQHGEENGVSFTVIPQYESARFGCWHLHLPARIQFRKYIKQYAPDLIHGFGTESAYGLVASEQGLPGVVFIQGIQSEYAPYYERMPYVQKKIRQSLEARVVKKITGLIAETAFAENWAKNMCSAVKVAVIPHAVNPEFFEANSDSSFNECLCIGTVDRRKAVDVAIRALSATRNKELRLSVIGTGPLLQEMKYLASQLRVEQRVDFLGHFNRAQIIGRMAKARMLVIAARMDTSPNILTEAHAAGLPVVGTRAGGIPDMIEDGKDGFLVNVDDFQAVAEKMDLLASDVDLCRKLGSTGRDKVKWLNDPDRIADLHVKFYHEILGK